MQKYFIIVLLVIAVTGCTAPNQGGAAVQELSEPMQKEKISPPSTVVAYQKAFIMLPEVATEHDIVLAKENGANMIVIFPSIIIDDNKIYTPYQRDGVPLSEKMARLINAAHRNGLQVELRTGVLPESKSVADAQAFRMDAVRFMSSLAEFAEEYKVYHFTPFGEIENGWLLGDFREHVSFVSKDILAAVRAKYSGKVGMGVCCPAESDNFDFHGYDYLLRSIYMSKNDDYKEFFETSVDEQKNAPEILADARKLADSNGIKALMIGETGITNPDDPDAGFSTKVLGKEEEAEFYNLLFEKTSSAVDGYGIFYGFPIMSVKGDPAEPVVKKWFDKL